MAPLAPISFICKPVYSVNYLIAALGGRVPAPSLSAHRSSAQTQPCFTSGRLPWVLVPESQNLHKVGGVLESYLPGLSSESWRRSWVRNPSHFDLQRVISLAQSTNLVEGSVVCVQLYRVSAV